MHNFVLQTPSLQRMAEVKMVAHLWNQADILSQMTQTFNRLPVYALSHLTQEYKATEAKVERNAWALPLPEPCKKQLLNLIKPLGTEIITWCHYHTLGGNTSPVLNIAFPRHFCWTMHGTVDYSKTTDLMIKDEGVDVVRRYEVACINCLEDEARELLKSISADGRQECIDKVRNSVGMEHRFLVVYFTCLLSGDVDELFSHFQAILLQGGSVNKYFFRVALRSGNPVSSEYFFAKLKAGEKEWILEENVTEMLRNCARFPLGSLMYYVSLMNEEQQERLIRERADNLLRCLLRWPLQSLFVETARRWWQFINSRHCIEIVICEKFGRGFQDYDYLRLLGECWRLTSVDDQQLLLANVGFLKSVLETKREELITFILSQVSSQLIADLGIGRHREIKQLLTDDSVISDAALMECKQTAALNSSKKPEDAEMRLKSASLSRLVDIVIGSRVEGRLYRIGAL